MTFFALLRTGALAADEIGSSEDELLLAGFEYGIDGFRKGDNVRSVELYTFFEDKRNCLEVKSYDIDTGLIRTVSADFGFTTVGGSKIDEPIDLSEYQRVAYDVYIPALELDPEAEYYMRTALKASDGSILESITQVEPDTWTTVVTAIGEWQLRDDIIGADFSLIVSSYIGESSDICFYLDEIRADHKLDRAHTERYMLDDFTVSGGYAYYDDNAGRIVVELSENMQASISGTVFASLPERSVNSIRIRLENLSDSDNMLVTYSTLDSEERSVSVRLERSSDPNNYYIDVGDISRLKRLSLSFDEGEGNVLISSICAVSKYDLKKYPTCGNITDCVLTDDLLSLRFTGDIGRDEAILNQSGTLRIYAVEPGTEPDEIELSTLTPIVESPMTTKFDLTAELESADEDILTRQFIAISQRLDGSYQLIDDMFYLENPEKNAKISKSSEYGKKGIVSSDISLVDELRADSTMLELEVDRVFAKRGMGESYICQGATYYINAEYFESLKAKLEALNGAGVGAVLRITGWSEEYADKLAEEYSLDHFVGFSEYNSTPDGTDFLAAIGSYAAERLCLENVSGMILGECENFLGETDGRYETLNEMAEGLSIALRTLYNSAALVNSDVKIYLSISNLYSNELSASSSELGADELLPALCSELERGGSFPFGLCIEDFYRMTDHGDLTFDASDPSLLISLLRGCGVYDTHLIFCDSNYRFSELKTTEKMTRAFESYYSACFNSQIDAVYFLISDSDSDQRLMEVLQWMDSDRSDEISELMLSFMELGDWSERIDGFDRKKLKSKTLSSVYAATEVPKGIKGRYSYFSFDSFSGVIGFDPGFYCESLNVVGNDEAVLEAVFDPTIEGRTQYASAMGISYRFEYSENMKLTPVLELKLGIETQIPTEGVNVQLILTSGDARFEAELKLTPGEMQIFYIDISDFSGIRDVDGIQLLIDGSVGPSTLSLAYINGLSRDYNDESLESVIADERMKKRTPEIEDSYRNYIWIAGGVIVGAATVLTVMLLSRRKEDEDE